MTANVFQDEKTLGAELVRFHRSHSGQPIEGFLRFILAPYLLKLLEDRAEAEKVEAEKKVEKKKGKGK